MASLRLGWLVRDRTSSDVVRSIVERELRECLESRVEIADEISREEPQRSMDFRLVDAAAAFDRLEHLLVVVVARSLDCCHLCH